MASNHSGILGKLTLPTADKSLSSGGNDGAQGGSKGTALVQHFSALHGGDAAEAPLNNATPGEVPALELLFNSGDNEDEELRKGSRATPPAFESSAQRSDIKTGRKVVNPADLKSHPLEAAIDSSLNQEETNACGAKLDCDAAAGSDLPSVPNAESSPVTSERQREDAAVRRHFDDPNNSSDVYCGFKGSSEVEEIVDLDEINDTEVSATSGDGVDEVEIVDVEVVEDENIVDVGDVDDAGKVDKPPRKRRRVSPAVSNDGVEIVGEGVSKVEDVSVVATGFGVELSNGTNARPSSSDTPATCSACSIAIASSDDSGPLVVSRCKHKLCASCAVNAVADVSPESETDDEKLPQVEAAKVLPVCPVRRCRAPLSQLEVRLALVPLEVDGMLRGTLDDFNQWIDCGGTEVATMAIEMPFLSEAMAELALHVKGSDSLGDWLSDDLQGAYAPLWLYESEEGSEVDGPPAAPISLDDDDDDDEAGPACAVAGNREKVDASLRWICAACGLPSDSNGESRDNMCGGDASNPPLFLHCANARAYGLQCCVTELIFASNSAEQVNASVRPKRTSSRRRNSGKYRTARGGFAKGTGYGGTDKNGAEWAGLSKSFLEKTAKADLTTAYWLVRIRAYLLQGRSGLLSWPLFMRPFLRQLCLIKQIAKVLSCESIMDIGERVIVCVSALRVIVALIETPSLHILLTESAEGINGRSVVNLILSIARQAALLWTGAGADNLDPKTSLLIRQVRRCMRAIKRHDLEPRKVCHPSIEPYGDLSLSNCDAVDDLDLDAFVDEQDTAFNCAASGVGEGGQIGGNPTCNEHNGKVIEEEKKLYVDAMRDIQFETVVGLAESSSFYKQAINSAPCVVGRGDTMRRIATEVASLCSSLPLDWSSTIVVRVDQDRYDFLQAMITGPDGSPYSCGCFIFDVHLPFNYPSSPPKFKLLTTGGGKIRFNPNLYNCGKVCLSLLGTWAGPSWTPASTLLQVLVSIQSLILVDDPYFNEPGYESSMGTAHGKAKSAQYSKRVRRDNVTAAMLGNLRKPPFFMASAVRTHFRLKRLVVKKLVVDWFPESASPSLAEPASAKGATCTANSALLGMSSTGAGFTNLPDLEGLPPSMAAALHGAYKNLHPAAAFQRAGTQRVTLSHESYLALIAQLDGLG